jgi:signal transduction histidine kinase
LFAASRSRVFRQSELELLKAFGQQAAASLWNARLYRRSEQRRKAGETLARMSFTASTSIHELRNHIGATKMHIQLMSIVQNNSEAISQLSAHHPSMVERLNRVSTILKDLHEPWKEMPTVQANINNALDVALDKVMSKFGMEEPIDLELVEFQIATAPDLPPVMTSPDMLIEAFKALIQNGLEAIAKKEPTRPRHYTGPIGTLRIESRGGAEGFIEVLVQDDGVGIASTNLEEVFELGWTTKPDGVGFGLFWMRDYIEGLGGSVRVESKLGEGTKFVVRLPQGAGAR